jgi:hypothetical protein
MPSDARLSLLRRPVLGFLNRFSNSEVKEALHASRWAGCFGRIYRSSVKCLTDWQRFRRGGTTTGLDSAGRGLPTLNGFEAARQLRKLVPESKIIFLSQESSDDVVQEALSIGAWGYVVKTRAGTDLLAAVEAVMSGKGFVSSA